VSAPTPREITRKIDDLERQKLALVCDWSARTGSKDWTLGEKATAPEKKAINASIRALREERKAIEGAEKSARLSRIATNKAARAATRDAITAECQICEGRQCMNQAGRMVHHGYQRPGHGYIVGDCFGVSRLPFPAYDALEAYLPMLAGQVERLESALSGIDQRVTYTLKTYSNPPTKTVRREDVAEHTWRQYMNELKWAWESELRWYRGEVKRVESRIVAAKAAQL
jgi:hypothetical protein